MIARLQKSALLAALLDRILRGGRSVSEEELVQAAEAALAGRQLGRPFTRFRPAVTGEPISGPDGRNLERNFQELQQDLQLLYRALIQLLLQGSNRHELFSAQRERLTTALLQFRTELQALLAAQGAASRDSAFDSFHTLEHVDPLRTTATLDLAEGSCSLPPDPQHSVSYDGSRVQLVRALLPPGGVEYAAGFAAVFSPRPVQAWQAALAPGLEYVAEINVTGADYEAGATAEISLNALRIEPTGPCRLRIDWSPDGFNWHALDPEINLRCDAVRTLHFAPITVGYLRFRISGDQATVGIKRVQLLRRGWVSQASLYSQPWRFSRPVSVIHGEFTGVIPFDTELHPWVALSPDGPWSSLQAGPHQFDTLTRVELPLLGFTPETDAIQSGLWSFPLTTAPIPLPDTGELLAGREQLELSAFRFDWQQLRDREHLPQLDDWEQPRAEVRSGTFTPLGELDTGALTATSFSSARSPVLVDRRGGKFLGLCLRQGDGQWVLQPGYNYRVRAWLWAPVPTTLEQQRCGIINPGTSGGLVGTVIAPHSLYINGEQVYQGTGSVTSVAALSGTAQHYRIGLRAGWNEFTVLLQLPTDLNEVWEAGSSGIANRELYFYFQPDLFSPERTHTLGISEFRATPDWQQVSETRLRWETPIGVRNRWAWRTVLETGVIDALLLNHDPFYTGGSLGLHTLDGVNAGEAARLTLSYTAETPDGVDHRTLYLRVDLSMGPQAVSPPILDEYRLL